MLVTSVGQHIDLSANDKLTAIRFPEFHLILRWEGALDLVSTLLAQVTSVHLAEIDIPCIYHPAFSDTHLNPHFNRLRQVLSDSRFSSLARVNFNTSSIKLPPLIRQCFAVYADRGILSFDRGESFVFMFGLQHLFF